MTYIFPPIPPEVVKRMPVVAGTYIKATRVNTITGQPLTVILGLGADERAWGVLSSPEWMGYLTYWSYGLDYAHPQDCIQRERARGPEFSRWYFNGGGMGWDAVFVDLEDLARAFREIGYDIPEKN